MGIGQLLKWQWSGYPRYHKNRTNLLLHIFSAPVFLVGTVLLVAGVAGLEPLTAITGAAGMLLAVAVQGSGHKMEKVPSEPFTSLTNAVSRLFVEQWITFPRFVLSGGWYRNLNGRAKPKTKSKPRRRRA